ncbi:MAG TPA: VanZ family protein [Polyangiaceae bacterium]|nr:VanZ family protein [Polyangiaceae bacterium]
MAVLVEMWRKPRGFGVDVAPALVYLAALFWFGLTPLKSLPGPEFRFADKVWHFLAFAVLVVLLARALWHWGRRLTLAGRDGALLSAGLGALLEVLQSLTAFRSAEVADLVADGLGALAAYFVLRRLAAGASETSAPDARA